VKKLEVAASISVHSYKPTKQPDTFTTSALNAATTEGEVGKPAAKKAGDRFNRSI
jgi:hypothetical protein